MSAQGIALGPRRAIPESPEGAQQTTASKHTVHQTRSDGGSETSCKWGAL